MVEITVLDTGRYALGGNLQHHAIEDYGHKDVVTMPSDLVGADWHTGA
jgi:hypothetical protein